MEEVPHIRYKASGMLRPRLQIPIDVTVISCHLQDRLNLP